MYATHRIQSYDDNKTAIIRHECPGSTCVVCSPRFLRFFSRKSLMGLLESAASINWEHESFPEYGDFVALPVFALFFFSVRFFLDRFVFQVPCFINPVELFYFFISLVSYFVDQSFIIWYFCSIYWFFFGDFLASYHNFLFILCFLLFFSFS